jgi:hypothetical protein
LIIYIAGKVTGIPHSECKEKFTKAEFILKKKGYSPINPLRLVDPSTNWQNSMKICIRLLLDCDAIYLLQDWKKSKGAKIEFAIAKLTGLKIIHEN